MIFAFLHATLGWLLASLACVALRRRPAASRCWAWRLGLLKGPFALLLGVPVAVAPVTIIEPKPVLASHSVRDVKPSHSLPLSGGGGQGGGESVAAEEALSPPSRPTNVVAFAPIDPLPLLYGLGVVTVVASRLLAGRRVHAGMPRVEGVLRPRVVVPDGLAPEAAAMALAHEAAHVRRRDPLWSLVADLTCAAFWFAPPVWLCARGLRAEAEAACDVAALEATAASRKAYARLLLDFAGPAPANALGGPARRLARRILMLDTPVKPFSRPVVAGLLAIGLLTLLPWRAVAVPPVSDPALGQGGPEKGRLHGPFGAGVPATRLPLRTAAGLILDEPGVRARIGWTAAQDAELKAGSARAEKVLNAHRAEMVRRQATGPLKAYFDWDARERKAMFARADEAAGPMPWTPDQESALKALALARFGSALWLDPQVSGRLHLTPAQRAAIWKEDTAIAHAAVPTDMRGSLLRPTPKVPKSVVDRLKTLKAAYLVSPREKRAALGDKIANLERPYQPIFKSRTLDAYKVRSERRLAQSWRMRMEADRRLAAKLSAEQRARLDRLERASEAWQAKESEEAIKPFGADARYATPEPASSLAGATRSRNADLTASQVVKKGSKLTVSSDIRIDGQRPETMPVFSGRGELTQIVYLPDGSAWKIYAEGDKAPYRYSVERAPAPQKSARSPLFLDYASGKPTEALRRALVKGRAKANVPPVGTPWTEESIRRTLHLQDGEKLEFKPDPDHPGVEVAEMADREGIVTKYRIYRRNAAAGGTYTYEVESIIKMPVKPKP